MPLFRELRHFGSHPLNMRVLLVANAVYALVGPVLDLFTGAFVMRNTHDVRIVMAYQLAVFVGIPLSFIINGHLFGRVSIRRLYALGFVISGLALVVMMALPDLALPGLIGIGVAQGMAQGLMWSSRNFLALSCTEDGNRNYYCGLESFFGILAGFAVPLAIGGFIELAGRGQWFASGRNTAYLIVSLVGLALAVTASFLLRPARFTQPPRAPFIFWRFHPLWRRMQVLTIIRGVSQGFLAGAPAMLVFTLVGGEGALGMLQSAGSLVAAVLLYLAGRWATPAHRLALVATGLAILTVGCLANAILYDAVGVAVILVCLLVGRPLMDLAYGPLQWLTTDVVSRIEGRGTFAYVFSAEWCFLAGRLVGGGLFIGVATGISAEAALRYALVVVVLLLGLSLLLVRPIVAGCRAGPGPGEPPRVPGG